MIAELRHATPYSLGVNLPYAVALAAVTVEATWILATSTTWERSRLFLRSTRVAAAMGLGGLAVGAFYTVLLRSLWTRVGTLAPVGLVRLWRIHAVVGAVVAFVAWDAVGWMYHWVGHRTRIGWASHRPHHTGESFDMTLGLRQSWIPFHGLAYQPLLALAGFDFRVIAVCAAVSNCWQVLEHSSVGLRLPTWLTSVVMTPDAHRHHHASDAPAINLGPVLTCWDRMAATWVPPGSPPPRAYGVAAPRGVMAAEVAGWRDLVFSKGLAQEGRGSCRAHSDKRQPGTPAAVVVDGRQSSPIGVRR